MIPTQCEAIPQGFADETSTDAGKLAYAKCIPARTEQLLTEQCNDINDANIGLPLFGSEPLILGLIFVTIVAVAFTVGKLVKQQNKET